MSRLKQRKIQNVLFLLSTLFCLLVFSSQALAVTAEVDQVRQAIREKGARWLAGENEITSLPQEHRRLRVGTHKDYVQAPQQGSLLVSTPVVGTPPATLDYRNYNGNDFVTPVRNQGNCGSCWAFGTTAALESQVLMSGGVSSLDLAEQILISCSGAGNCNGGYIDYASNFIQNTGLPLEVTFPNTDTNNNCSNAAPNWQSSTYATNGWVWVATTAPTVTSLKSALASYGPLVTTMEVYSDFFSYNGGVYSYVSGTLQGGHAVELIGYDDVNQCFIVKNSWGTNWGESGFFRIAYSQVNQTVQFGYYTIAFTGSKPIKTSCSYTISPTAATATNQGGTGTVYVSTQSGCSWTAQSNVNWITVSSGATGTANGSVGYKVAQNTGAQRTGTMTIAGKTFTVTQDANTGACSYAISPTSASGSYLGGTGTVLVSTQSGCSWTAQSNVNWISISSGSKGTGNGYVRFNVARNSGVQRTGTLTIAGKTFTVTQGSQGVK